MDERSAEQSPRLDPLPSRLRNPNARLESTGLRPATQVRSLLCSKESRDAYKDVKGFAKVWFVLTGLFIVGNLVLFWYFEGFSKVQEILSPFNVVNFIAVLITLAPGISAHMLAERLDAKKR